MKREYKITYVFIGNKSINKLLSEYLRSVAKRYRAL